MTITANFALNNVAIVTNTNNVNVAEGVTATFQVKLSAEPTGNVTVTVARTAGDDDISVTGGAGLTFTTSNWQTYQTVTLSAAEDADISTGSATITCSSPSATNKNVTAKEVDDDITLTVVSDGNGSTIPSGATIVDTDAMPYAISATGNTGYTFNFWSGDTAGVANVNSASTTISTAVDATITANFALNNVAIVADTNSVNVVEGSAATFQVELSAEPTGDVQVTVSRTAGDADINVTGGSNLTFTTSNWYIYQTVTLSAAEDADTSIGSATVTCSSPSATNIDVTANEIDNDILSIATNTDSVNVVEGSAATFQVKLSAEPTGDVQVTVSRTAGDGDISVTGGSNLTFTTSTWNTYQTVTLSAAEDTDTSIGSATITCSSPSAINKNITANEVDDDITLTVNNDGNGSTTPSGATIIDSDAMPYAISATANTGYSFEFWSGDTTGIANVNSASTTITTAADATITANFSRVARAMPWIELLLLLDD
jgi:hypothetical protein